MRMKAFATTALVLALTGSAAAQTGKVWVDESCAVMMQSAPKQPFTVSSLDGGYSNRCRVTDWPASSPTATLMCADRTEARMTLDSDGVVQLEGLAIVGAEGMTLYPKGDRRVNCD